MAGSERTSPDRQNVSNLDISHDPSSQFGVASENLDHHGQLESASDIERE
jgi:hypothetical protein